MHLSIAEGGLAVKAGQESATFGCRAMQRFRWHPAWRLSMRPGCGTSGYLAMLTAEEDEANLPKAEYRVVRMFYVGFAFRRASA